jgi:hypothetical protein
VKSGTNGASYTCSNSYADTTTALAICPFDGNKCGSKSQIQFSGTAPGETSSVTVNLPAGETCTFQVKAACGLPTMAPLNDTTGIDIQLFEYDDDDLAESGSRLL